MAAGGDKLIALSPPGAIGLPAEEAIVLLRFDEEAAAQHPKDAAGNLADLGITGTLTVPAVVDAVTGRGRAFSPSGLTGYVANDIVAGSTLLTRDLTIQVILSLDAAAQNAAAQPGTIIARGLSSSSSEYLAFALEVAIVTVGTSSWTIRFRWQDPAGGAHAGTAVAFTMPPGFTMLTATRRWISPTSILSRFYIGDVLLAETTDTGSDIGGATVGTTQVGARFSAGAYGSRLAGVIDELLVLDHEITREEIEATWLRITRYQPFGVQLFTEMHDPGFPMSGDPSSDAQLDIRMTGQALGYAAAQIENIRANALPQRAYGSVLEQWEEVVRVTPQPVQDVDTRRARVLAKVRQRRGSSISGLQDALVGLLGGASTSQLQFLAYDNTVSDSFTTVDPLRWDVLPNGGGGIIAAVSGAASFQPGVGTFLMDGSRSATWVTMRQSVGGEGKQAHQLVKLAWTTPQSNAEAGIYFENAITGDYLLLGLRDLGGSFRIETESFIARVSQGVVQQAIIGANPAAIWLHLFQTTTDGTWQAAWSTTSATAGFTLSANITHPTVAHWGGCYLRSVSPLGSAPRADFDDHVMRYPFGHRPTNAYVFLDSALGFSPDIDGAHSVIQTVKHAFVFGTFITSKNVLCDRPFGCDRGPMGGGL